MQADVSEGTGIPYIGRLKDGRTVLYLFDTYEAARTFSDGQDGALDGIGLNTWHAPRISLHVGATQLREPFRLPSRQPERRP